MIEPSGGDPSSGAPPLDLLNHALLDLARDRRERAVRPRAAASLIVVDRSAGPSRVLMGRRNHGLAFMGGVFVFPGGRVDRSDARASSSGALPAHAVRALAGVSAGPRALALAAIRETFEETGYLVGEKGSMRIAPAGAWTEFAAEGIAPSLDGLGLVARAVTPPGPRKRFDAAFFIVDADRIAGRVDRRLDGSSEMTELVWIPLDEADRLPTHAITKAVLHEARRRLLSPKAEGVPFYRALHGAWRRDLL